jgi:hypothetical protein
MYFCHSKWLISENSLCPWDEQTCEYAAMYDHLDVLQWLRSQDLHVLQWAISQNPPCPWNAFTC